MTFTDFPTAAAYLAAGKSKTERPAPFANTRVRYLDADTIAVALHATDIVTYHRDGRVVLDTGGWYTQTTKRRIEEVTPYRIGSTKGRWTVVLGSTPYYSPPFILDGVEILPGRHTTVPDWTSGAPYGDGMVLRGQAVLIGPDPAVVAAQDKHNAMVRGVTARAYKKWAAAGKPTNFDPCEQCDAMAAGAAVLSTTHLHEHIATMLAGRAIPSQLLYVVTYESSYNEDYVTLDDHRFVKWLRSRLYLGPAGAGPSGRRPATAVGHSMSWQSQLGQAA